jgi:ribonuclease VapC
MSKAVLDASALLALLNAEKGARIVQDLLPEAVISTVNLAEVVTRLSAVGMPDSTIRETLSLLGLEIVDFTEDQAFLAGYLAARTHHIGLSLGDRACLALADLTNAPAITADRAWNGLDVGVEIHLIR